uniref:Ig-like domain-containing protein n=1 Tax=Cyprinus carpio TaxID=7962 RepID=A0A8C1M0C2_CYPCA
MSLSVFDYKTSCISLFAFPLGKTMFSGLIVHGPSGPLLAPLGSSVVLPCSVDELLSVEGLEVEWRRTDSETLVHLYQDGESRTEAQQQDYQDRAHFFTDQIQHGNFSLRLDNLRAEDEGQYKCKVYIQQESGETVVQIKVNVERLRVSGSDQHISASVGEDVTLSCSVDSHIPPGDLEEVSWKKTDEDIQVLLYQDNEAHSSNERYIDRVELFPAEIPKGNFSLRLKSIRTEDKGVYMCEVFGGGLSANATVVLEQLGFSVVHIMMLILCISASGSALLLFCLIYCRSPTKGLFSQQTYGHYFNLGSSVVMPCHVDECLLKKKLKVEWRRKDTKTLVHLYEDGETRSEKQHKDYQDRADFFTDDVQHGNFSLRLDNLRAADAGEYICTVRSDLSTVTRTAKTSLVPQFKVKGSSGNKTVPLGGSVVLPCEVDESLLQKSLKVEWRRTDSETLVHLYEDGESQPKKQHKDYHHRAHFITEKIKDGDFSIRLEKLRAEDAGKYTCKVYSDQDCVYSADAELEILRFDVQCSCHTLAPLGSSVVLPSYKYKPLPVEDLKVKWEKVDATVHLYQDGETQAEAQQQDYQNRAHFFTDQIQHGDFSLRLDDLRAEDEGKYTCTVYSQQKSVFSAKTNLEQRLLDTAFRLQMLLVFCPNVLMFLAFVLWGVSEGSLFESVSCCALYFLRPLTLLWTAPYINNFTGKIKTWVRVFSFRAEYIVFSAVFYSVLFKSAWDKSLNYAGFEGVMIIVLFVMVILFNLFYIIYLLLRLIGKSSQRVITIFNVLAGISFDVLPSLQFILLFVAFGSAKGGFIIVAVLPVFTTVARYNWDVTCGERMGCKCLMNSDLIPDINTNNS